jgi:hypothetical protein
MTNVLGITYRHVLILSALFLSTNAAAGAWPKVTPPPFNWSTPPPPALRIRNVQTSQCLFVNAGGPGVNSWGCWSDPNMRFYEDPLPGGQIRLRHVSSNLCLGRSGNLGRVYAEPCGTTGTNLTLIPDGSGLVRISFPKGLTGQLFSAPGCLYQASATNGTTATTEPSCSSTSATRFKLEPAF